MGRLDDHHHRTTRERDAMRALEAERQRQKQREHDRDPGQLRQVEPHESKAQSNAEDLRIIGPVLLERTEYAVNETPVGDAAPVELVVAANLIPVAVDVYQNRNLIAADLKGKVEKGREAAGDLVGELAHRARSVGLAAGEAAGRAVAQVAGPIPAYEVAQAEAGDELGKTTRLKADLAMAPEAAQRLAEKNEAKAERRGDLDIDAALRALREGRVQQEHLAPQRDEGIDIGGP